MTADEERWAEALVLYRTHGETTAVRVAERIGVLARVGDGPGVGR